MFYINAIIISKVCTSICLYLNEKVLNKAIVNTKPSARNQNKCKIRQRDLWYFAVEICDI